MNANLIDLSSTVLGHYSVPLDKKNKDCINPSFDSWKFLRHLLPGDLQKCFELWKAFRYADNSRSKGLLYQRRH